MVCWQAKGVKKTDTASVGLWDRDALINYKFVDATTMVPYFVENL